MSGHATLGPSASRRWMNCPGSVQLSARYPDTSSPAAEEGTFAHDIAAKCLDEGRNASSHLGHTGRTEEGSEFTVDDEMVEALQVYIDIVRALRRFETPVSAGWQLLVEAKVKVAEDLWGTADALVFAGRTLHVVDLKYGAGVLVTAENNSQLMTYGYGALLTFLRGTHQEGFCEEIVMHIVQPRHRQGGHTFITMTRAELELWGEFELLPAAAETREESPGLDAGGWCRWCPAKAECSEISSRSLRTAQSVFAGDPLELVVGDKPDVSGLPPAEIGKLMVAFPMIEEWIKAVRSHAFEHAKRGGAVPGFKLVDKVGNRKWRDEKEAVRTLEKLGADPWAPEKAVSPAQAEKALKAAHVPPKSARNVVDLLAFKPSAGTSLVPNSDKRSARVTADVFDVIPEP